MSTKDPNKPKKMRESDFSRLADTIANGPRSFRRTIDLTHFEDGPQIHIGYDARMDFATMSLEFNVVGTIVQSTQVRMSLGTLNKLKDQVAEVLAAAIAERKRLQE